MSLGVPAVATLIGLSLTTGATAAGIRVVTTIPAVYAWASALAVDGIELAEVPDTGANPHDYEPRPSDWRQLARADVLFLVGGGVDAWAERGPGNPARVHVFHGSAAQDGIHAWLDINSSGDAVATMARELAARLPSRAGEIEARRINLTNQLHRLDASLTAQLEPLRGQTVALYHSAFSRFCDHYGLRVAAIAAEAPENPPGTRRLASFIAAARAQRARALLVDAGDDLRLARQLAGDLKIPMVELDALEGGAAQPNRYETAMRANALALLGALR